MEHKTVLITTTIDPKSKQTLSLVEELSKIIPNSRIHVRTGKELPDYKILVKIVEQQNKPFSILISKNENEETMNDINSHNTDNEDNKLLSDMKESRLNNELENKVVSNTETTDNKDKIKKQYFSTGELNIKNKLPIIELKIIEYKSMKDLRNKADTFSIYYPELVINNFESEVGCLLADWLLVLFPMDMERLGNRVVSFTSCNDYIFFRVNRYRFKDREMVDFQDIGPHLTLRVRKIIDGEEEKMIKYEKITYNNSNVIL